MWHLYVSHVSQSGATMITREHRAPAEYHLAEDARAVADTWYVHFFGAAPPEDGGGHLRLV